MGTKAVSQRPQAIRNPHDVIAARRTYHRKRYGHHRNNERWVERVFSKGWRDNIRVAILEFMGRQKPAKSKVIPVYLRPHVPHVRADLAQGGDKARWILAQATALLPEKQYRHTYEFWEAYIGTAVVPALAKAA